MGLRSKFLAEIARLGLPEAPEARPVVGDEELAPLPEAVRRYLDFMGAVGRPRDRSFRVAFSGRLRLPRRVAWSACETWQYGTGPEVSRTSLTRLRLCGLPVLRRDTYRDGRGERRGRLLDLLTIVEDRGDEVDAGALASYLGDLVLFAPSMLLAPAVRFAAVDEQAFDVTLSDGGRSVGARVLLDQRGAPRSFETADGFREDPDHPGRRRRARWSTLVTGFQPVDGRPLPTRGQAVWHLPEGELPFAYFEVVPGSIGFNLRPGE